jgi:SPOR domain
MAKNKFQIDRERDYARELARQIAHADPYEESTRADNRFREETASEGYDERPGLPPAPQLPADLNAREQECEFGEYCDDDRAYAVDNQPCAAEKGYRRVAQRARRTRGSVMAIVGLAMLGTAGAFGYHAMFGGSLLPTSPPTITASIEPHKIGSTSDAPQTKNGGKANKVGADITGSIVKLVSREEEPVTIKPWKSAPRSSPRHLAAPNQAMPHLAAGADPRGPAATVAVTPQSVGQPGEAPVPAAATRAHVAAVTIAPVKANGPAAATPRVTGSGFAVQVTSERNESNAQAALAALQAKHANQLSGRQLIIRRTDLGARGTYYRVLVSPFALVEEATALCSRLKAAGDNCIVQRN